MGRILVVDDEERNLRLIETILGPLGYELVLARNGEEAIEKARRTNPDVILLDVMMPGMDGYEVVRKLREGEETKLIPIVMVTALSEVQDRVKALEVGADDFLTKPVERTELIARVRQSLKVKAYYDHLKNYQRELEAEVRRKTEELRRALSNLKSASLETIYRLSKAAEYKDEETGAHILRMSHYAALVAKEMGMGDEAVEAILYAAPMHDIGKIGIPDRILLKPGKLDPEEWAIMEQHTIIGATILEGSSSEFIRLAEVIALTHHERWDGTGYPRGLKGEEIPMAGRIAAIADVFDALTSRRPYRREPYPLDLAFAVIENGRGSHFDPDVVDAFFRARDGILEIKERYKDRDISYLLKAYSIGI
jgi:putative two-component system response regulator